MCYIKVFYALFILMLVILVTQCSGNEISVMPDSQKPGSQEDVPIIGLTESGVLNATGLLGAYEFSIDPETMTAELIENRSAAIGESFLFSGLSFFLIAPCKYCLSIVSIEPDGPYIRVNLVIRHPFEPGDPSQPPSGFNRLDLNIFDPALVIMPLEWMAQYYELMDVDVYPDIVMNADGYTRELGYLTTDPAACPYVLAVDDSDYGISTFNVLKMGAEAFFNVVLGYAGDFAFYLTFGYGTSAEFDDLLYPKYYNPEFNRKAAWKVNVVPPEGEEDPAIGNTWDDFNNAASYAVTVEVYDWQAGATVWPDPLTFDNAPPDFVYAPSEVESVSLEIPGLTHTLLTETVPVSGTGMPDDPLIYTFYISNQGLLDAHEYPGLVRVMDERQPMVPPPGGSGDRDFLIDSPNGTSFHAYPIHEFATYQTFIATVVPGGPGILVQQVDYIENEIPHNNSPWGCVKLAYEGSADPMFFNLTVDDTWVVQNMPMMSGEGEGVLQSEVMFFDLGVDDGVEVRFVMAAWVLDALPMDEAPMDINPFYVHDRVIHQHGDEEPLEDPGPLIGDGVMIPGADVVQEGTSELNQECGRNECVPAAVSNNLHYLQRNGWVPPTGTKRGPCVDTTSIGCWKKILGTTSGGTSKNWWERKERWSDTFNITTRQFGPHEIDSVIAEINGKQAVEMNLTGSSKGHCVRVTHIQKHSDSKYTITIAHDVYQRRAGGCIVEKLSYNHYSRKIDGGNRYLKGRKVNDFIVQCPK